MDWPGKDVFKTLAKVLYLALALVLVVWFFHLIRGVLLASVLALILAIAISAPVTWMEQRNIPRGAGTGIAFFGLLGLVGLSGWLVVPRLAEEIPELVDQVPDLLDTVMEQIEALAGEHPEVQRQVSRMIDWAVDLFDEVWQYADVALGAVALTIFVLALAIFIVAYMRPMLRWYVKSFAPELRDQATEAFSRSSKMVIGWVYATVILGTIKAIGAFTFLTLTGIDGAMIWSLLAFLGAFVPHIGFYVMTIPPVLMAIGQDPMLALWTLIFFAVFSEFLGRFIAPIIYAETMELNPVYVLFMVIAVGYAFGVIGVLIATPIAGFIKVYYDEFYLKEQPPVDDLDDRVEAIMKRESYKQKASEEA